MKSNLFVTGLLLNGEPSFTTNNPVTNKLYFTKEKFVHEEIVCFYLLFKVDSYLCNYGFMYHEVRQERLSRLIGI